MRRIGTEIETILQAGGFGRHTVHDVAAAEGHEVASYARLVDLVAEIAYRNPRFTLLFRGQHADYRESVRGGTLSSLFPTLWRHGPKGRSRAWSKIDEWCRRLQGLNVLSRRDRRHLRAIPERPWAILQHYSSVTHCDTPLLDVTENLRVAASFATHGYLGKPRNTNHHGVVFVLGFPPIQEGTTVSVDDGLILLRLASVCPQSARRPHFQCGFLAGTYPTNLGSGKTHKNFAHRLVGKLRISADDSFWDVDDPLREAALFPPDDFLREELERSILPEAAATIPANNRL